MLEPAGDTEAIIERVAALDIGKAELMCCVRIPADKPGGKPGAGGQALLDDDPLAAADG
jgi:hypothetical protein